MLSKNKIYILFFFSLTFLIYAKEPLINILNINPDTPYIGTSLTIKGNGFNSINNISINNLKLNNDSLEVLEWNDNIIKIFLSEAGNESQININNKLQKKFNTKNSIKVEYFNTVKYLLNYSVVIENIKNQDNSSDKIYIYVPQPVISDETISKTTLSITPTPKYVQDNDIYIYELDHKVQNRFIFNQELEITTVYKKINFDNTSDNIDYEYDSNFYKYYTKENSPFIIPNNEIIKNKTEEIINGETNKFKKLKLVYDWVVKKMTHVFPPEDRSPLYSMEKGEGDCLSDAFLFTSLIRAAKMPVRMNAGYIFYHNDKFGSLHFWEDVFIPGAGWIPVDISYSHNYSYLKLQEFETATDFYFGGVDGRRMSFSRGRTALMKPDVSGKLLFYKYIDYIQVPYVTNCGNENKLTYDLKKRWLDVKSITPLFDEKTNWFNKQ